MPSLAILEVRSAQPIVRVDQTLRVLNWLSLKVKNAAVCRWIMDRDEQRLSESKDLS